MCPFHQFADEIAEVLKLETVEKNKKQLGMRRRSSGLVLAKDQKQLGMRRKNSKVVSVDRKKRRAGRKVGAAAHRGQHSRHAAGRGRVSRGRDQCVGPQCNNVTSEGGESVDEFKGGVAEFSAWSNGTTRLSWRCARSSCRQSRSWTRLRVHHAWSRSSMCPCLTSRRRPLQLRGLPCAHFREQIVEVPVPHMGATFPLLSGIVMRLTPQERVLGQPTI